jgi:hypothetical protein
MGQSMPLAFSWAEMASFPPCEATGAAYQLALSSGRIDSKTSLSKRASDATWSSAGASRERDASMPSTLVAGASQLILDAIDHGAKEPAGWNGTPAAFSRSSSMIRKFRT